MPAQQAADFLASCMGMPHSAWLGSLSRTGRRAEKAAAHCKTLLSETGLPDSGARVKVLMLDGDFLEGVYMEEPEGRRRSGWIEFDERATVEGVVQVMWAEMLAWDTPWEVLPAMKRRTRKEPAAAVPSGLPKAASEVSGARAMALREAPLVTLGMELWYCFPVEGWHHGVTVRLVRQSSRAEGMVDVHLGQRANCMVRYGVDNTEVPHRLRPGEYDTSRAAKPGSWFAVPRGGAG